MHGPVPYRDFLLQEAKSKSSMPHNREWGQNSPFSCVYSLLMMAAHLDLNGNGELGTTFSTPEVLGYTFLR